MINEIIARLASVPALKQVGGAADFQSAAESNPTVTPCAFVIPLQENPQSNELANFVIQRVTATIGVMLVVRNVADQHGVAAQQDLAMLRQAVKDALLGWQPSDSCDPLERGPSNLLVFKDGHMWWQDIYVTTFYDRSIL